MNKYILLVEEQQPAADHKRAPARARKLLVSAERPRALPPPKKQNVVLLVQPESTHP